MARDSYLSDLTIRQMLRYSITRIIIVTKKIIITSIHPRYDGELGKLFVFVKLSSEKSSSIEE